MQGTWLAIGVFDGVHIGHQTMLDMLSESARAEGAPSAVLTFNPHPAETLGKQVGFKWLSPIEERSELILDQGVDHVILQHFDRQFATTTARIFMETLSRKLGLRHLLIGHDFALGHNRQGNVAFLAELGKSLEYVVHPVDAVTDKDGVISSTLIRELLRKGQVSQAASKLGRNYSMTGEVIHGDGRGRTINIPTANLALPEDKLVPLNGVYACWASMGSTRKPAVTNIGTRPTFSYGDQVFVETHLLDHQQEIYGQVIKLDFVERLRAEKRFPDVQSLLEQINKDIDTTRSILY
ncbi:bifunctional riboflavin kinase/FAD synthetase [Chloroflexota bacterium]